MAREFVADGWVTRDDDRGRGTGSIVRPDRWRGEHWQWGVTALGLSFFSSARFATGWADTLGFCRFEAALRRCGYAFWLGAESDGVVGGRRRSWALGCGRGFGDTGLGWAVAVACALLLERGFTLFLVVLRVRRVCRIN